MASMPETAPAWKPSRRHLYLAKHSDGITTVATNMIDKREKGNGFIMPAAM